MGRLSFQYIFHWTISREGRLKHLYSENWPLKKIARDIRCSVGDVVDKIKELGLTR